ncbi:rutC family protein UK114 isoform X3 [Anabrus simplex]|uniref:rutC family protein UK114 isoform X3 n=1 Tax=Anabrus simplex TaxID=316456 RepID=UPI0035A3013B
MSKAVRKIICTASAPKPVGPYKDCFCMGGETGQAVRVDNTVYVSGVLGLNKDTMKLVDGGALEEAKQALINLGKILEAADSSYGNVVKTTIFLDDINDFAPINELYKEYFKPPFPARSTFQVGKLPMGAKVEIEVIALSGEVQTVES